MGTWKVVLKSTIFQKFVIALTGIGLSVFITMHVLGNMLILVGPETYNYYSYKLITNPLLPIAEIGLAITFLVHIIFAITLTRINQLAQAAQGSKHTTGDKAASFASRTMIYTGLLTLVFLVLHLITFKWGTYYEVTYHGVTMRNLYRLIVEKFSQPLYVGYYVFSLIVLGLHTSHGVSGLFQSLGITTSKSPTLRKIAWVFAILVASGFISQPIYVILTGGKPS